MTLNMIVVFFVYGLAFFILGFAIILYPKKGSAFKLAKDLWLIGAFGILHGINEWIDMFILIQKPMEMMPLKIIRVAILPVSFLFLIYFGAKTIAENKKKYSTLKALPIILFVAWGITTALSRQRFLMGDVWARYLLGIPGTLLTSYALILQIPEFKKIQLPGIIVNLKLAAGAFLFYGLFGGFIVPQADIFPASFFNYTVFLDMVGIPVQVFRSLIALTLAYCMIQVLGMFEWETLEKLQTAHDELESEIIERKRAEEKRRLLQKINNMLNAGVGRKEVFKTVVDGLRSLYNYDSVAIHLLSKDQKHIIINGYSAESKVARKLEKLTGLTVRGYKVPLYEGSLLKEVVDTKKPVITDDVTWVLKSYTDRKSLQGMAKAVARLTKARWGIGVPLLAEDKVVGIIGCGSIEKLTEEDAQRLANFGAQAGLAIEKAQMYERLKSAYDRLEKSNQLKDLFTDIMTHDLLNPAGVARNLAEIGVEEEKDSDKKEVFQRILRSSGRIIDMIENASILAKLESGEELEFEERDLGNILKSVSTEMTPSADEKKMKIKIPTKGEFRTLVNPLIYNIFSNLINNAIKYGPEKSDVVVGIEEDGSNWKISITDNGPGIPDEDKEGIFNRYKRIEKGAVKGTGLGLAIVKKVAEVHKGRVWVEDNPEGGSIFYVTLPKTN